MDPTTAVAVTAGKELVKKTDSYLGLVLKPMLTTIGRELDERVKEKFEEMKAARRATNLSHHIKQAEEIVEKRPAKRRKKSTAQVEPIVVSPSSGIEDTPEPKTQQRAPSVQAIDGVEKWIKGAQDVDPDDDVMAPIWQELLADLMSNETVDEVVIDALRNIKSHELSELLRLNEFRTGPFLRRLEPSIEKSLIEKGLVHKSLSMWVPQLAGLFVFGILFVTLIPNLPVPANEGEARLFMEFRNLAGPIGAAIVLLSLSLFLPLWMLSRFSILRTSPSWLGREILRRAERVQKIHAHSGAV